MAGIAADNADMQRGTDSGERALAAEVLRIAVEDASALTGTTRAFDRYEARLFCLAQGGAWARARAVWCERAGLDPEAFAGALRRRLGPL